MIKVISLLIFILLSQVVKAQNLFVVKYNKHTGAIEAIQNKIDIYAMNFVYEPNKKAVMTTINQIARVWADICFQSQEKKSSISGGFL